jgi:hypothetical protein
LYRRLKYDFKISDIDFFSIEDLFIKLALKYLIEVTLLEGYICMELALHPGNSPQEMTMTLSPKDPGDLAGGEIAGPNFAV